MKIESWNRGEANRKKTKMETSPQPAGEKQGKEPGPPPAIVRPADHRGKTGQVPATPEGGSGEPSDGGNGGKERGKPSSGEPRTAPIRRR